MPHRRPSTIREEVPIPPLNSWANHSGAPTNVALSDGSGSSRVQRAEGVGDGQRERIGIIEMTVIGLGDNGQEEASLKIVLGEVTHEGIAHHANLMSVGQTDRRVPSMPDSSIHGIPVISPLPLSTATPQ